MESSPMESSQSSPVFSPPFLRPHQIGRLQNIASVPRHHPLAKDCQPPSKRPRCRDRQYLTPLQCHSNQYPLWLHPTPRTNLMELLTNRPSPYLHLSRRPYPTLARLLWRSNLQAPRQYCLKPRRPERRRQFLLGLRCLKRHFRDTVHQARLHRQPQMRPSFL